MKTTFYGKGVAVAGMKTSCGAVLLAGQFTDVVEWGGGGAAATAKNTGTAMRQQPASIALSQVNAQIMAERPGAFAQQAQENAGYDLDFVLTDEVTGAAMADWPYVIELANGRRVEGRTDHFGKTAKVSAEFEDNAVLRVFARELAPINPNWDQ